MLCGALQGWVGAADASHACLAACFLQAMRQTHGAPGYHNLPAICQRCLPTSLVPVLCRGLKDILPALEQRHQAPAAESWDALLEVDDAAQLTAAVAGAGRLMQLQCVHWPNVPFRLAEHCKTACPQVSLNPSAEEVARRRLPAACDPAAELDVPLLAGKAWVEVGRWGGPGLSLQVLLLWWGLDLCLAGCTRWRRLVMKQSTAAACFWATRVYTILPSHLAPALLLQHANPHTKAKACHSPARFCRGVAQCPVGCSGRGAAPRACAAHRRAVPPGLCVEAEPGAGCDGAQPSAGAAGGEAGHGPGRAADCGMGKRGLAAETDLYKCIE